MRDLELRLEVIWCDADVLELAASASNESFMGRTRLYVDPSGLAEIVSGVRGFPENLTDARAYTLGAFGRNSAGGAMSLRFYCADRSGHVFVAVKVESDKEHGGFVQTAELALPVEPAAIDAFVGELREMGRAREGSAVLRGRR